MDVWKRALGAAITSYVAAGAIFGPNAAGVATGVLFLPSFGIFTLIDGRFQSDIIDFAIGEIGFIMAISSIGGVVYFLSVEYLNYGKLAYDTMVAFLVASIVVGYMVDYGLYRRKTT
jgi:hypothetical protein